MADEKYTFETARIRLEEIAAEARKKDTSLEKSLDLLEEGVRLANICTELVDHTDMSAPQEVTAGPGDELAADTEAALAEDIAGGNAAQAGENGLVAEEAAVDTAEAGDEVDEEYDDEDEPSDASSAE